MEAEMVPSLSPLVQGADQWGEMLLLLPLLVALEAVLSADNAIALAAISRRLHDPTRQRQALNLGLLLALLFRLGLIAAARWVLHFPPLQLLASGYLLVLCGRHLLGFDSDNGGDDNAGDENGARDGADRADAIGEVGDTAAAGRGSGAFEAQGSSEESRRGSADTGSEPAGHGSHRPSHGPGLTSHGPGLTSVVLTLALTDLAFSLDSVAAAVAVTDRMLLVMAGGVIGIIALRLTAELFIRWLEVYSRLETAGYLAVGLVGLRLLLRVLLPDLELPDWSLLASVALLFLWGFSRRLPPAEEA
ncbi:MAG: TerC family protein [Cyanobium sp.]